MKSKFIFLFFACFSIFTYAESFINEDSSFISSDSDFVNSDSSFTNRESSFVSDESSFINKDSSFINPDSNFIDSSGRAIGVYDIVVSKTHRDVYDSVVDSVVQEIVSSSYSNGYGKWLEIVSSADASVRKSFVQYFSDWQWSGQNESFFEYSKNRAEREQQIERMYDVALAKFGAGTAIVATTWIVSYVLPSGTIISASMLLIAKITTMQAISGAVIGGITQAGVSYLQGKRGEELLYATLNGASDGYLVGAITGLATGTFTAVKTFSGAVVIGNNIYTKADLVLDMKGNLVGKTIRFAGANGVDDIYYIGKNTATVFDRYGKEVARVVEFNGKSALHAPNGKLLGYLRDGQLISNTGLNPNVIHASCGYQYKTDNLARICNYSGQLRLQDGIRNTGEQILAGGIDRLKGDQGGHLFAYRFGGSGGLDNLVAMSGRTVNQGAYKKLENLWAEALESGKQVFVDGQCIYEGDSMRPVKFIVSYIIDGIKNKVIINNH